MEKLSIPLTTNPTRPLSGWVVWIFTLLLPIFTGWLAYRIVFYQTPPSSYSAVPATLVIDFPVTSKNLRILQSKTGEQSLAPLYSGQMNEILLHARRHITYFFSDGQLTAIRFRVNKKSLALAKNRYFMQGKFAYLIKNQEQIAAEPPSAGGADIFSSLRGGTILLNSQKKSISLTKKGISAHHAKQQRISSTQDIFSSTAAPIFAIDIRPQALSEDFLLLLGSSSTPNQLIHLIEQNGARLVVSKDEKGTVISFSVPSVETIPLDMLADLTRDAVGRLTLTTQALTLNGSEEFSEIRRDDEHIKTDIQTNANISTIVSRNVNGDIFRITQSPTTLSVTNREISNEIGEFKTFSSCLSNPQSFVKLEALSQVFEESARSETLHEYNLFPIFAFTELAENDRKTRFCW